MLHTAAPSKLRSLVITDGNSRCCTQELEESRRLYSSQKRALKEALNAAAEKEANEVAADEASRTAVAQAVEDEMEQLHHQLALTKVGGKGYTLVTSCGGEGCVCTPLVTSCKGKAV